MKQPLKDFATECVKELGAYVAKMKSKGRIYGLSNSEISETIRLICRNLITKTEE